MGLYKNPHIEDYWKSNILYECFIPKVMTKANFKLLSIILHFPEKIWKNDKNENDNG